LKKYGSKNSEQYENFKVANKTKSKDMMAWRNLPPNVRVGIFINREAGWCVLDEKIGHTNLDVEQIVLDGFIDIQGN
jgi:hypothetical protein